MSNKAKGRTLLTGATGIGEVAVRRSFTPNRITRKPRRLVLMRIDRDTLRRIDEECARAGITRGEAIARAVNSVRRTLKSDAVAVTPASEEVAA